MSKIEMALRAAEKLPAEMQEQLAENLLHYVDKYLALQDEIAIGIAQAERGELIDGRLVMAELRERLAR
jgi:predicted transcriptional regulator